MGRSPESIQRRSRVLKKIVRERSGEKNAMRYSGHALRILDDLTEQDPR